MFPGPYTHDFSPFLIEFGNGYGIRWYGLSYVTGFVILWMGLHWQIKRGWLQIKHEQVVDLVTACIVGVIVGGRLGYCLAYAPDKTFADPLFIFRLWEGGMASHGGILGVMIGMIWFAVSNRILFYNIADAVALFTPVGLGLGRMANFINGELYGRPTEVSWAWYFPKAEIDHGVRLARHPSQLYEAFLEGLVLFLILLALRFFWRSNWRNGGIALGFMLTYPILRIIGECYRQPDLGIGYLYEETLGRWLTQGQLLSVYMFVIALVLTAIQFRGGLEKKTTGQASPDALAS